MRWGKRHYHRESYLTRQHAKYKQRLKKKLIPGYGQHRKYDVKQWQNRVHQRYYRCHTYPSASERIRMWGEGYNPHPKRRTYRTTRHSSVKPVNNKANIHKTNKSSPKESANNVDDDPATGAVGCGCSSLVVAFILGVLGAGVSGFLLITVVLLIADWFVYRSNKKTYDKKQQKKAELNKQKAQQRAKAKSNSSSANSSDDTLLKSICDSLGTKSAESAQVSSSSSKSTHYLKVSESADYLRRASLANSTTDSLEEVLNSVLGASERGHGFNTSAIHHSILHAEDSITSIYPKKGDSRREYALYNLHGMYNDATGAGEAFNSSGDTTISLHVSVHGLGSSSSDSNSSKASNLTSSASSNHSSSSQSDTK